MLCNKYSVEVVPKNKKEQKFLVEVAAMAKKEAIEKVNKDIDSSCASGLYIAVKAIDAGIIII